MKEQNDKPPVTPPESHKDPSFPTLAALGILTAATTLVTGCAGVVRTGGKMAFPREAPTEIGQVTGGYFVDPSLPDLDALPCQYRVGSTEGGNTLSGIAKIFYGDASKWPAIWEANKAVIKNPDVIRNGMDITIPKLGD